MSIPEPPLAATVEVEEQRHGRRVVDPYRWLRDDRRSDQRVLAHLRAENAYTAAVMAPTTVLQHTLYEEMVGRIKETDVSVPVRIDDRYYYTRTEQGLQYPIHCRKQGNGDAPEEVLLDQNRLADGHDYLAVGAFAVSPDHRLLAFSTEHDGSERFTLQFKDLHTGRLLADRIPHTYDTAVWSNDSRRVFYTTVNEAQRPYRVFCHLLGSDPRDDRLVYQEDDEAFYLDLYKTKDRRFVVLVAESAVTTELRCFDADRPDDAPQRVHPRRQGVECRLEHRDGTFFLLTNDGAVNFRLVAAPVTDPSPVRWTPVIEPNDDVKLDRVDVFAEHLVVSERRGGLRQVRVIDLADGRSRLIEFPEPVYTVSVGPNPEFQEHRVRLMYESPVTPRSVYDYDMRSDTLELKKRQEVPGGFDARAYACERVQARAADGVDVPVSLVYRRGLRRDGRNPLLLYGYGAYGYTIEPGFDSSRLSLLDRDFVYAIAHVRGGGALGRRWYEDGKLLRKKNTFSDFIAAAEHLIGAGYTSAERLAIRGGSAGGLLVGAVINMRPELFRVAVANVPFVDVLTTMLDPTLPLTVTEWEEWGDPREPRFYDYLASYSPYDNVRAAVYPDLLVTSGLHDPRVSYWEPAKWVARLRATNGTGRLVLLKTHLDAGHRGASGRYDSLKELAFEYAFILTRLSVTA